MNPPSVSEPCRYEIVLKGHLDESSGYWFEDLLLTHGFSEGGTPITTLAGEFVDQAALHGVLATIRDLNLSLLGVWPTKEGTAVEPEESQGDRLCKATNRFQVKRKESQGGTS